jgi:hypothetical protein
MLEKKIITDRVFINTTGGVTFEELTQKYNKEVEKFQKTYENVHDIVVSGEDYEYNDGENYEQVLRVSFKRLETDGEYKRRVDWFEFRKQENAKGERAKLMELAKK